MTSYKKIKTTSYLLLSILAFASHSFASNVDEFFDRNESTVYDKKELSGSNRESDNPIVTINKFKTDNLFKEKLDGINELVIEKIIEKHQEKNNKRYTIDRLTLLTDQLTNYYRSKGYILAKVFLPKQDIKNRTLNLDIVFGKLEKVSTMNNDHYSSERLERPFKELIGKPVTVASLESTLLELKQYPGVDVKSRFREGDEIGNTQIDVFVQDEKISDFNFKFDNYGSKYTGSMRGTLTANIYNLADMADQLSINLLATVNPTNSLYFGGNYKTRWSPYFESQLLNSIFRHGYFTEVGYQQSQYEVGAEFEKINVRGETDSIYFQYSQPLILKNDFKLSSGFKIEKKTAASYHSDQLQNEDKLAVFSWNMNFQWNDRVGSPSANGFMFTLSNGLPGVFGSYENGDSKISRVGNNSPAPMDFSKINLTLIRNQQIGPYQLLAKARWQYTDDLLLSSELSNLGGAHSVRGYKSSDFSGDRTSIYTLEISGKANALKYSLPISDLKLAGFFDYGTGVRLEPDASIENSSRPELISIGGYAQFLKEGKFSSKMEIAIPLKTFGESKKDGFEVLFNFDRGF